LAIDEMVWALVQAVSFYIVLKYRISSFLVKALQQSCHTT